VICFLGDLRNIFRLTGRRELGRVSFPACSPQPGWQSTRYKSSGWLPAAIDRHASGAELRIRAAGFPARKTLEDFDWDAPAAPWPEKGGRIPG
jgi:hypothetical protein